MIDLENQVVLITGGGGGLGRAMGKRFRALGAKVALCDLDSSDGQADADALGDGVEFFAMDVTDEAAVHGAFDAVAERLGPVTGCVANAGIAPTAPSLEYALETWNKVISINQTGVFLTAQAAGRAMAERGGSIVLTSSIAGLTVVHPERHIAYGASKAAVSHMAALLGVEWAKRGIRVNAIAPGYVNTSILDAMREKDPETYQAWVDAMPIGRLLEPEEVADAVAFLLSDLARAVTGETLACDGGYSKA